MKTDIVGSGKVYIAPSDVARSDIKSDRYYAGTTCGESAFSYYEKIHTATDERGNPVRFIPHSHSAVFSGRFMQLDTDLIFGMLGISKENENFRLGERTAPANEVQFLFSNVTFSNGVETEYQIYIKGSCTSGLSMTFSNTLSHGILFEINAVCGDGGCCAEFGLI